MTKLLEEVVIAPSGLDAAQNRERQGARYADTQAMRDLIIAAAFVLVLAAGSVRAQTTAPPETAPDGTKLACMFYFKLFVSEPASSDCGGYEISLNRDSGQLSERIVTVVDEESGNKYSYALLDLPLRDTVLLMATRDRRTRIVTRRDPEIVMFFVGRAPFVAPPPMAVLPRASRIANPAP